MRIELQRIKGRVRPRVAGEDPSVTATHLLGIGVHPVAAQARERAAVAVAAPDFQRSRSAEAEIRKRRFGALAKRLPELGRIDIGEPNAQLALIGQHGHRITVMDGDDPGRRVGPGRKGDGKKRE